MSELTFMILDLSSSIRFRISFPSTMQILQFSVPADFMQRMLSPCQRMVGFTICFSLAFTSLLLRASLQCSSANALRMRQHASIPQNHTSSHRGHSTMLDNFPDICEVLLWSFLHVALLGFATVRLFANRAFKSAHNHRLLAVPISLATSISKFGSTVTIAGSVLLLAIKNSLHHFPSQFTIELFTQIRELVI